MFDGFFKFVAGILAWFYALVPNYGIAIALLTISVMLVITPLTLKSTRSMIQMQRLQPELKTSAGEVQGRSREAQHRDDGVLQGTRHQPAQRLHPGGRPGSRSSSSSTRCCAASPCGTAGRAAGSATSPARSTPARRSRRGSSRPAVQPEAPRHTSEMYQALIHTTKMRFLGMDLSLSPLDAHPDRGPLRHPVPGADDPAAREPDHPEPPDPGPDQEPAEGDARPAAGCS